MEGVILLFYREEYDDMCGGFSPLFE